MTKKTRFLVFGLILGIFTTATCACVFIDGVDGNGKVVKENREVKSFTALKVGGAFDVYLTQGDKEELIVEADENLMNLITTTVRGNTLIINTKKNIRDADELNLYITFKELEKMDFSGAVEVESDGKLTFDRLLIKGSGASEIDLKLTANKLECNFSGASEIDLTGQADYCSMKCSGASELDAEDFVVKEYNIEITGAGEGVINCTDILNASVSGAASIRYYGDPKVDTHISGAGSIKPKR
jgi:hypothetical protein